MYCTLLMLPPILKRQEMPVELVINLVINSLEKLIYNYLCCSSLMEFQEENRTQFGFGI